MKGLSSNINMYAKRRCFDVSYGQNLCKGHKALEFVQWVSSNDASVLSDGKYNIVVFRTKRADMDGFNVSYQEDID